MNEETDKEIKKRIEGIFPHPSTASAMVDLIVHKRPRGWSRKSNATYYKEIYAKQMRESIDTMIASGNRLIYRYETWCNEDHGDMSPSTLYLRINQSIRYLIEQMDTDEHKYAKWYETVRISREKNVGVIVEFIPGLANESGFKPDVIEPKDIGRPPWERQMDEWLESNNNSPFVKEGLALAPEEIVTIKIKLQQLSNVMANVTSSSIKIVKVA